MTYKFKVEVYRRNPYEGVLQIFGAVIGIGLVVLVLGRVERLPQLSFPVHLSPSVVTPVVTPVVFPTFDENLTASLPAPVPDLPVISAPVPPSKTIVASYIFQGKALYQGIPFANAQVLAKVSTPRGTRSRRTFTGMDGSYRVVVPIRAKANELLDWTMEAQTAELQNVQLAGRQIFVGDQIVSIHKTITF